jgi:uncharacterized protein YraI
MAKPGFGGSPRRLLATASRWSLAFACAALLPLAAPVAPTAAQEAELAPGGAATVANTDGDGVVLREGPGYDARVLDGFPEGTAVALTDGPIYADDGSVWYGVVVGGRSGYVVSDYLTPGGPPAPTSGGGEAAPLTSAGPGAATIEANDPGVMAAEPGTNAPAPAANPGSTATTPAATAAEGTAEQAQTVPGAAAEANVLVNLRSGPGEGYEALRVLPPGAPVTVTGPSEGGWTPVWYNGSEGYIADAYLDAADGEGVAQLAQELPADTDTDTDTDTGSEPGPPAGRGRRRPQRRGDGDRGSRAESGAADDLGDAGDLAGRRGLPADGGAGPGVLPGGARGAGGVGLRRLSRVRCRNRYPRRGQPRRIPLRLPPRRERRRWRGTRPPKSQPPRA